MAANTPVVIFDKTSDREPLQCRADEVAENLLAGDWFPAADETQYDAVIELKRRLVEGGTVFDLEDKLRLSVKIGRLF